MKERLPPKLIGSQQLRLYWAGLGLEVAPGLTVALGLAVGLTETLAEGVAEGEADTSGLEVTLGLGLGDIVSVTSGETGA